MAQTAAAAAAHHQMTSCTHAHALALPDSHLVLLGSVGLEYVLDKRLLDGEQLGRWELLLELHSQQISQRGQL